MLREVSANKQIQTNYKMFTTQPTHLNSPQLTSTHLNRSDSKVIVAPPNGLQLVLENNNATAVSDTVVMLNLGYYQMRSHPGLMSISMKNNSKGVDVFEEVDRKVFVRDYLGGMENFVVERKEGMEGVGVVSEVGGSGDGDDTIHVFSLCTGGLYERFLKIMMLSVSKRTSKPVKFWLLENYLSPSFKESAKMLAKELGFEVEFVTYKWPHWLRHQTELQRIIWGYKILFLDVLFPIDVKKVIYIDADQVLRADLVELWDMDLDGKAYAYTPFCSSREETLGYQFWKQGFWEEVSERTSGNACRRLHPLRS